LSQGPSNQLKAAGEKFGLKNGNTSFKIERGRWEVVLMEVRSADFAGSWYPGSERECRRAIEELSQASPPCPGEGKGLVGGVVPHAGWFFSGKIACSVIKCLSYHDSIDTCIVFGRHLHPGAKNYIMKEGAWATPLGALEIDTEVASRISEEFPFALETPRRHEQDNTIELQLPFIKFFFPEAKVVPVGVPPAETTLQLAKRTAEIASESGRRTIVIGSTDLTHYGHNYGFSPAGMGQDAVNWVKNVNDKRVMDLMIRMDAQGVIKESLTNQNACCAGAAAAAITAARVLGAKRGEMLTYSTSYDIRPDNSFVGYVGIVFSA
jgi:AmmeMemoRadiSam system protein B